MFRRTEKYFLFFASDTCTIAISSSLHSWIFFDSHGNCFDLFCDQTGSLLQLPGAPKRFLVTKKHIEDRGTIFLSVKKQSFLENIVVHCNFMVQREIFVFFGKNEFFKPRSRFSGVLFSSEIRILYFFVGHFIRVFYEKAIVAFPRDRIFLVQTRSRLPTGFATQIKRCVHPRSRQIFGGWGFKSSRTSWLPDVFSHIYFPSLHGRWRYRDYLWRRDVSIYKSYRGLFWTWFRNLLHVSQLSIDVHDSLLSSVFNQRSLHIQRWIFLNLPNLWRTYRCRVGGLECRSLRFRFLSDFW